MTDEREENSQKDEVKTLFVDIVHFTQIVPSYFFTVTKKHHLLFIIIFLNKICYQLLNRIFGFL